MDRLLSSQRRKPNSIPDLDLQLSHSGNEQFKKVFDCNLHSVVLVFMLNLLHSNSANDCRLCESEINVKRIS